jgi:hypothetical protein
VKIFRTLTSFETINVISRFCVFQDSIVRCIIYSLILTLLALYLIFYFLIPNLRSVCPSNALVVESCMLQVESLHRLCFKN